MAAFTSDERQLLHESLVEYFKANYPFERFRELTDRQHPDGSSREAWAEYASLGWLGVALPENAGGSAGGMTELAIVMSAAGGALALEPFLPTLVLGAGAIELAGTAAQQEILGEVNAGERLLAFCHTEPDAGFARGYVKAVATPSGGGYTLTGEKSFALHAHAADTLVVSARLNDDKGPIALFLVPRTAAGIELTPAPTLDERRGAAVRLTEVAVEASACLGESDTDRSGIINEVLDRAALAVCAEAAGAMATAMEQTVEYTKTREQFGQPLSKFQVLQHRMVDMSVAAEGARAAIHGALRAYDEGSPGAQRLIWRAKVETARAARFVGGQGIQLHGGMGMTDDLAIGHYYKRLTLCETLYGDADWYLGQLAQSGAA